MSAWASFLDWELERQGECPPRERIDRVPISSERASHGIGVVALVEEIVHPGREPAPREALRELQIHYVVRRDAMVQRVRFVVVEHLLACRGERPREPRAREHIPRAAQVQLVARYQRYGLVGDRQVGADG